MTASTVAHASAVDDDPGGSRAAIAELARPGDLVLLAGELGAGKTAFAQGFGRGLGVTEPITSPTFTLVHQYDGPLALHHLDVYRLEHLQEVARPRAGRDARRGRRHPHRVGRRHRAGAARRLPRGPLRASAKTTTTASLEHRQSGRWSGRRAADRAGAIGSHGGSAVLILGIETATAQVGCAIGGHEGVLALVRSRSRGTAPRRDARRRPSSSSCSQARIELDEIGAVAVDLGPGPVHRPAGRRGGGEGDGAARCGCR